MIDEKINEVIKRDFNNAGIMNDDNFALSQIRIDFYNRKASKKSSWFGQKDTEDSELWESWVLYIKCLPINGSNSNTVTSNMTSNNTITSSNSKPDNDDNITISIKSFEKALATIIDNVDAHKDHIPPITSLDSLPFPYTITTGEKAPDDSWGKYIKKILD